MPEGMVWGLMAGLWELLTMGVVPGLGDAYGWPPVEAPEHPRHPIFIANAVAKSQFNFYFSLSL